MKKSSLLLVLVFFFCACGHQQRYSIQGHLNDPALEGSTVYLCHGEVKDSTVVANGEFCFKGSVAEPTVALVYCMPTAAPHRSGYLVLERGSIYIDLIADSLSGTPRNDFYYTHICCPQRLVEAITAEMYDQVVNVWADDPDHLKAYIDSVHVVTARCEEQLKQGYVKLYEANRDNGVGAHAIVALANADGMTYSQIERIMGEPSPCVAQDSAVHAVLERARNIENTQPSKPFADFEAVDYASGNATTLGAMIEGKVALVDFWASWCSPCRREISENLIGIYNEYAKQGLVVIGVDVNDKRERFEQAVKDLAIPYPQLIDTANISAHLYGYTGIPFIILIGKDGTILNRDIRGEEIEYAVYDALSPCE